jgi:hypothetical protein
MSMSMSVVMGPVSAASLGSELHAASPRAINAGTTLARPKVKIFMVFS